MLLIVAEVLTDGGTGVGSEVEHGSWVGRRGGNDNRLIHDAFALQALLQGGNFG